MERKRLSEDLLDEYHEELDDYYEKNPEELSDSPEEGEEDHYAQDRVDYQAGISMHFDQERSWSDVW